MTLHDLIYHVRDDRKGYLWIFIIACIAAAVFFFSRPQKVKVVNVVKEDRRHRMHDYTTGERADDGGRYYAVKERKVHLQRFDPNTADSTVLLALGLQTWQVRAIYRYRAAGGVYSRPEDFARLYGLSVKKFRELLPYITIADDYRPASDFYGRTTHTSNHGIQNTNKDYSNHTATASGTSGEGNVQDNRQPTATIGYLQKLSAGQTIDINTADTMNLRRVPGIGAYFARKIARYRDQLGGFINREQLLEIQDFPESALPYLTMGGGDGIKKLNVNKATNEQLRRHPYITFYMARCICDYRRMRGNIRDINDLRLLPGFTPEIIAKLRPYVEY